MKKILYHGPDAKNTFERHIEKCFLSYPVLRITKDTSIEEVRDFAVQLLIPSFSNQGWIGFGPVDNLKSTCFDALLKGIEESLHNVVIWCYSISSVSQTIVSRVHPIWSFKKSSLPSKKLEENILTNILRRNIYEIISIFNGDSSSEEILKEMSIELVDQMDNAYLISLWGEIRSIPNYDFVSEGLKKKLLLKTILEHLTK